MFKGNIAKLKMEKSLIIGERTEDAQFIGEVLDYQEDGKIYFLLPNAELTELSLNAIYKCEIQTTDDAVWCTGTLVERYCADKGKVVKMKIENGFYKINIK